MRHRARERDKETVKVVNALLDGDPVDVAQLRKVAAVRGLVTDEVRARAWPKLLGVDVHAVAVERWRRHALERHRDSSTVQCDVDRSLWHLTPDWSDDRRAAKRAALQRVLNGARWNFGQARGLACVAALTRVRLHPPRPGVVGLHCSSVYYYQARARVGLSRLSVDAVLTAAPVASVRPRALAGPA
jgi:hypothetical protein